jgi:hypothetical protein
MLEATLLRAVEAVRLKIATADERAAGWLAERDRRRRQLATFLRGIVRLQGSHQKAAAVTGMDRSTISRILDAEGHAKVRRRMAQARAGGTNQNVPPAETAPTFGEALKSLQHGPGAKVMLQAADDPSESTNVVQLPKRRRRPDWKPRDPRRDEIRKWFEQYLSWSEWAKTDAILKIMHLSRSLPDAAYYTTEPGSSAGDSAVGHKKRVARQRATGPGL